MSKQQYHVCFRSVVLVATLAWQLLFFHAKPAVAETLVENYTREILSTEQVLLLDGHLDIAIEGDTAVVGRYPEDVYIFYRNAGGAGNWGIIKTLHQTTPPAFGHSVALSGDTIAVTGETADLNYIDNQGVYIFERNLGGTDAWGMATFLPNAKGFTVALSGDYLLTGAPNEDTGQGAAYLYGRNEGGTGNWGLLKKLTGYSGSYRYFGQSVAINGTTAVVGAKGDHNTAGSARVFEKDLGGVGQWGAVKYLEKIYSHPRDYFGISVDISNDYIIVGAPGYVYVPSYAELGKFTIYERNRGGAENWGIAKDFQGTGGCFGNSVSLDGSYAIVNQPCLNATGKFYIYDKDANWGYLLSKQYSWDNIGAIGWPAGGVALSGRTVLLQSDAHRKAWVVDYSATSQPLPPPWEPIRMLLFGQ